MARLRGILVQTHTVAGSPPAVLLSIDGQRKNPAIFTVCVTLVRGRKTFRQMPNQGGGNNPRLVSRHGAMNPAQARSATTEIFRRGGARLRPVTVRYASLGQWERCCKVRPGSWILVQPRRNPRRRPDQPGRTFFIYFGSAGVEYRLQMRLFRQCPNCPQLSTRFRSDHHILKRDRLS